MPPWILWALLAAVSAAGVTLCGRVGLAHVDATLATTLRAIVMAGMLAALAAVRGNLSLEKLILAGRGGWWILAAGFCGAVSWLAYFAALKTGPAAAVAAIDRLSLPIIFVLGWLLLGEQPTGRGWLGLALVLAGVYLMAAGTRTPT
jgi:bacterial/archaeal transporter family protein